MALFGSLKDLNVQVTLAATAWMFSLVSSYSYTANTLPDIENEDFIKDCVWIHNKLRSEVYPTASDMLYMTWDPELSRISKAWAKNCKFGHNPRLGPPHKLHPNFTSLGENIWTGSLSLFSVSSAIINWYKEIQYYDFRTRRCNKVCGHYTQVVWAQSYKVGCAVQFCPRVDGFESLSNGAHFVCNYGPAGNYPTWPYKKGSTCSACHNKDTCLDNLCVNPQRDKVTRYYSVGYPGWPIYSRNRYTSLFLIARSIILLLSVIITILVKCKYPNLALLDE
ncbi:glioma pathogenesis-related protein 1 [Tupaia chinensis]|uniref:glioma pathogenesis-related protein 1 n=1 Tax=Tupaia chinensis TaxID=246437 RepID=UPI0003C8DC97|nr:glioma pathogenesis-related protein 1 [Tupaia chinensis]